MRRPTTFLLALVLLAGVAAAEEDHDAASPFTVADFEHHGVTLATAGPGEVDRGVELPGEVRPNPDRIAHLAPRVPGIAREVRAAVGDRVRAGDTLAIIESETLARFALTTALDGVVIDRHISPGEAVGRDQPAFIVADLGTVWVEVYVYPNVLADLRVGRPVHVAAAGGAAEADGTIAYLAPIVDQATRTARARVVLPNGDGAWRPGSFATVTVLDPVRADVVIPRRALQTLDGASVVFAVEGDRFVSRPVGIGRTGRTTVEITSGLAAGERFAVDGSFLVKAELAKEAGEHHDH